MNIVIDSNVLFSALIKDSLTRNLILRYDGLFLFPSFIFDEMEKHKQELMEKTKLPKEDFVKLLQLILSKVLIVPTEALLPYREEALDIVREIDSDDEIFMACALAHPNSVLWSDDKNLQRQCEVRVLKTEQIKKIIEES
jgi:predicted nucleic acid-binding protein